MCLLSPLRSARLARLAVAFASLPFAAFAQVPADTSARDTARLPFAISDVKRLSEEDLANKKEGLYFTGIPVFSSDPLNGFGYGLEGELIFNGKRTDPFFAYTPYRSRLTIEAFNTTRSQRALILGFDAPYVFGSKWRLRLEAGYESNPNQLYFGTTAAQSLAPLSYFPGGDSSKPPVDNASYSAYEANLPAGSGLYNWWTKDEYILNVSAERSYLDGRLRVLGGAEAAYVGAIPYGGPSLLRRQADEGKILGVGRRLVTIVQAGIVYDTRDLETDPGKGVFAEITNELSLQALGSGYNFNKTFVHAKGYQRLLPGVFKKLILAGRIGMGYTAWDAPFFEYQDQWSSEGSIEGLGGANTIRGYKQSRFLARWMNFANLELRLRFTQFTLLKQHLAFSAVPFVDAGGVGDVFSDMLSISSYRYAEGLGLRIAWNVNTILRFDYAVSKEDAQFFFNFGHAF